MNDCVLHIDCIYSHGVQMNDCVLHIDCIYSHGVQMNDCVLINTYNLKQTSKEWEFAWRYH